MYRKIAAGFVLASALSILCLPAHAGGALPLDLSWSLDKKINGQDQIQQIAAPGQQITVDWSFIISATYSDPYEDCDDTDEGCPPLPPYIVYFSDPMLNIYDQPLSLQSGCPLATVSSQTCILTHAFDKPNVTYTAGAVDSSVVNSAFLTGGTWAFTGTFPLASDTATLSIKVSERPLPAQAPVALLAAGLAGIGLWRRRRAGT